MFYEKKEKTPDEKLAIAKIQVMMEDAFGILSNSESSPALQDRAKNWLILLIVLCGVIWQELIKSILKNYLITCNTITIVVR